MVTGNFFFLVGGRHAFRFVEQNFHGRTVSKKGEGMRDVFAKRAREAYGEMMEAMLEELTKHTSCGDAGATLLAESGGAEAWVQELDRELVKVKYGRAVQSITGSNATVFHAVVYHDAPAIEAASTLLQSLGLAKCTEAQEDAALWWDTVRECSASAYRALKREAPTVPTKEQIASDIQARKSKGGAGKGGAVLSQGTDELLRTLLQKRGRDAAPAEGLVDRFKHLVMGEQWSADRSAASAAAFCAAFPEFGDGAIADDEWDILKQAVTFTSIEAHIPKGMMKGIESVAHEIARDGSGAGFASGAMDPKTMEKIGERVLGGVSKDDVNSFAGNIDKLLPIITTAMQR